MGKRTLIRLTADFLSGTTEPRREKEDIFQGLNKNICPPRILYPAKISSKLKRKLIHCYVNKIEIICC